MNIYSFLVTFNLPQLLTKSRKIPLHTIQSALRKTAGLIAQIQYSILRSDYLLEIAACAAAKRAIGTRNGEQET